MDTKHTKHNVYCSLSNSITIKKFSILLIFASLYSYCKTMKSLYVSSFSFSVPFLSPLSMARCQRRIYLNVHSLVLSVSVVYDLKYRSNLNSNPQCTISGNRHILKSQRSHRHYFALTETTRFVSQVLVATDPLCPLLTNVCFGCDSFT